MQQKRLRGQVLIQIYRLRLIRLSHQVDRLLLRRRFRTLGSVRTALHTQHSEMQFVETTSGIITRHIFITKTLRPIHTPKKTMLSTNGSCMSLAWQWCLQTLAHRRGISLLVFLTKTTRLFLLLRHSFFLLVSSLIGSITLRILQLLEKGTDTIRIR